MVTASSSRSSGSHRSSPAVKDKRASAPVQDEPEPDTDKMGVDQEGEQQGDHGDQAEAVADDAGEEDEDEEEEEYEIESIISHEIGHFEAVSTLGCWLAAAVLHPSPAMRDVRRLLLTCALTLDFNLARATVMALSSFFAGYRAIQHTLYRGKVTGRRIIHGLQR